MLVSLILATFGRTDDLGRIVRSLAGQTCRDFELLVVDQNADDRVGPHIEAARASGIAVKHLRLARPSLSGARNLGLENAAGDVIGFPDDDCWYEPDVIECVLQAFNFNPAWAGIVATWVEQAEVRRAPPSAGPLSLERWRRFRGGDAASITVFIRSCALRRLGGFDARLGVGEWYGAGEDTDLILSALGDGLRLVYYPDARVHHAWRADNDDLRRPRSATLRRARGTGAIYMKHRLDPSVIARGLIAPMITACWPWRGLQSLGDGVVISFGRLQGMVRWWLKKQ